MNMPKKVIRCPWPSDDALMIEYHDTEWGVPVHSDRKHFEFFILDAAQAGLSWRTVLHKRSGYKKAFANFDYTKVAKFSSRDVLRLMKNPDIIRNRQKIQSAVTNARAFLKVRAEFGTFDHYIWQFVNNTTIVNHHAHAHLVPATSPESDAMSKDLRVRGYSFCGSTICYAYMQAAGLVNDHLHTCFRYRPLARKQ